MRGNKLDTIKEWVSAHKTTLIQIGAVISIAILVSAIMVNDLAASKGAFTAEVARLDGGITTVGSTVGSLGTKVVGIEGSVKAAQDKLNGLTDTVQEVDDSLKALDTRMELAKERVDTLSTEVEAVKAAAANPLEAWLTGTSGNYTIHAKADKAGDYAATIHLGYTAPVALNATSYGEAMADFYDNLDTDAANFKAYVPTVSYNGTDWHLTGVSFSAGLITLVAKTEATKPVLFGGLHADYAPDWAYVEIWPVLKG